MKKKKVIWLENRGENRALFLHFGWMGNFDKIDIFFLNKIVFSPSTISPFLVFRE